MKIGPFILERKRSEDVRCFRLEGLSERATDDPDLAITLKQLFRDEGVTHLGVSTPDNLWCVEDPHKAGKAIEIFSRCGFSPREISPEEGRQFGRWSITLQPRRQGGRQ